MKEYLSYDDVLVKPQRSPVKSLSNVDTSTSFAGLTLDFPVLSAPMDTVTERDMAESLAEQGGMGVVHRFVTPEEQVEMVEDITPVAAAVGLNEYNRVKKLVEADVDMIVADIAHGHHEEFLKFLKEVDQSIDTPLCAGNVATQDAVRDFKQAGVDVVKVGVGPGAACTTREKTGAGVPQFSAVKRCAEVEGVSVIADGGIRKPGDVVKAIGAGADAVMVGSILGDTFESPKDGEFRGMSTKAAAEDRTDRSLKESDTYEEGEVMVYGERRDVEYVVDEYLGGIRSGISYCGVKKLEDMKGDADFVKVTNSTQLRNGAHGQS